MAHGNGVAPDERGGFGRQAVAFHAQPVDGVGTIQDRHPLAEFAGGLQAVGDGVDEGIDPGADILQVHQQNVDRRQHLFRGDPRLAIEAENGQTGNGVRDVVGLDHVVLLFGKKAVLGGVEGFQLAGKAGLDQIAGMTQAAVHRRRVAQQPQTLPRQPGRGPGQQIFKTGLNVGHGFPFFARPIGARCGCQAPAGRTAPRPGRLRLPAVRPGIWF